MLGSVASSPRLTGRTRHLFMALLALLVLVAAACANGDTAEPDNGDGDSPTPTPTETGAPDNPLASLVEEARAEGGELFLTWGQFNAPQLLDAWSADFEETYGLELNIINTPVTSHRENMRTAIAELEAGREASTDILLATPGNAFAAFQGGVAEEYDWAGLGGNVANLLQTSDVAVDLGGAAVPFYTALFGAVFNEDAVSADELPDNLMEFGDLPDEIVLGAADIASNMHLLADPQFMGEDLLPWFEEQWAPRVDGFANCADVSPLTTGAFDVYALSCGKHFADLANADGANLGFKVLDDATILSFGEALPMVHAPHPATARLFVDYLVSPSAQEILRNETLVDLHLLPGSVAEADVTGIDFLVANADYIDANAELEETILPQLVDILAAG